MKTRSNRVKERQFLRFSTKIFLVLSLVLFVAGFFILFHQYIVWGVWFEADDFFHHEVFAGLLIAIGCGFLVAPVILNVTRVKKR